MQCFDTNICYISTANTLHREVKGYSVSVPSIAYDPHNMASHKQLMVHDISPERFCSLDQRSMHADHQVLPETIQKKRIVIGIMQPG
jgi:hypothetical protein